MLFGASLCRDGNRMNWNNELGDRWCAVASAKCSAPIMVISVRKKLGLSIGNTSSPHKVREVFQIR